MFEEPPDRLLHCIFSILIILISHNTLFFKKRFDFSFDASCMITLYLRPNNDTLPPLERRSPLIAAWAYLTRLARVVNISVKLFEESLREEY